MFLKENWFERITFSYTRYCSEYFAPKDNVAVLYQRTFYNEDGTPVYDIMMNQGKEEVYRFKDKILYGKQAFMRAFMKSWIWTSLIWSFSIGRQALVRLFLRKHKQRI